MKVKSIHLKNFVNFEEISVNLFPDVTYLVSVNGGGKTTIGSTALYFILTGIAEKGGYLKGKRYRFIGDADAIASGTIVLQDEKGTYTVTRRMSADRQWLEITTDTGEMLDQSWLNGFFKNLMVSPMDFCALTPKEQARELGIDTEVWDEKIRELKVDFTLLGRELNAFGEVEIPPKIEMVDVSALNRQKNEALEWNQLQGERGRARLAKEEELARLEAQITQLEQDLQLATISRKNRFRELQFMPFPDALKDTRGFDKVMEELDAQNAEARRYEEAVEKSRRKSEKQEEIAENKAAQKQLQTEKTQYLQGLDLPFSNMTIDEDGGLLLDGNPIAVPYKSDGELLKIVPQIIASRNPEFKYLFIQRFDLMDEDNQQKIVEHLVGQGFQLVIEKVGKKMEGENVIILEEKIRQ